jgi:hypothetical protein
MNSIADIDELVNVIASYLDVIELLMMESTCNHWRSLLIKNWHALYYNIACRQLHNDNKFITYEGNVIGQHSQSKRTKSKRKVLLNSYVRNGMVAIPRDIRNALIIERKARIKWDLARDKEKLRKISNLSWTTNGALINEAKFQSIMSVKVFNPVVCYSRMISNTCIAVCGSCVAYVVEGHGVGFMDYSTNEWILNSQFIHPYDEEKEFFEENKRSIQESITCIKIIIDRKRTAELNNGTNVFSVFIAGYLTSRSRGQYLFIQQWKLYDVHNDKSTSRAEFVVSYLKNYPVYKWNQIPITLIDIDSDTHILICYILRDNSVLLFESDHLIGKISAETTYNETHTFSTMFNEPNKILSLNLINISKSCLFKDEKAVVEIRLLSGCTKFWISSFRVLISTSNTCSIQPISFDCLCASLETEHTIVSSSFSRSGRYLLVEWKGQSFQTGVLFSQTSLNNLVMYDLLRTSTQLMNVQKIPRTMANITFSDYATDYSNIVTMEWESSVVKFALSSFHCDTSIEQMLSLGLMKAYKTKASAGNIISSLTLSNIVEYKKNKLTPASSLSRSAVIIHNNIILTVRKMFQKVENSETPQTCLVLNLFV